MSLEDWKDEDICPNNDRGHEYISSPKTGKYVCRYCGKESGNVYDRAPEKRTFGEKEDEGRKRADFMKENRLKIFGEEEPVAKKRKGAGNDQEFRYKNEYTESCKKMKTICLDIHCDVSRDADDILLEYYTVVIKNRPEKKKQAKLAQKAKSALTATKRYRPSGSDDEEEEEEEGGGEKEEKVPSPSPVSTPSPSESDALGPEKKSVSEKKKVTKIRGDTDREFLLCIVVNALRRNGKAFDLNGLCKTVGVDKKVVNGYIKKVKAMIPGCDKCVKEIHGGNSEEYCKHLKIEDGRIVCSVAKFYDMLRPCLEGCKPQTISGVAIFLYFGRLGSKT